MIGSYQGQDFKIGTARVKFTGMRSQLFVGVQASDRNDRTIMLVDSEFPTWETKGKAAKIMLKAMDLAKAFNDGEEHDIIYDGDGVEDTVFNILRNH